MADVKLLDCTLRDGGYINDWHWGLGSARRIIQSLTRAGTDIVEVGFCAMWTATTQTSPSATPSRS